MIKILIQKDIFKVLDACRASNKDGREPLRGLHITKKHVEATDGRMLVRVTRENTGIPADAPAGLYRIVGTGKKDKTGFIEAVLEYEGTEYPKTDGVIPERIEAGQFQVAIRGHKDDILSVSAAILTLYKRTGNGYAGHLLGRLAPLDGAWAAARPGEGKPVRLDCAAFGERLTAVVMPFKLED